MVEAARARGCNIYLDTKITSTGTIWLSQSNRF